MNTGSPNPIPAPPPPATGDFLPVGVAGETTTAENTVSGSGTFVVFTHPVEDVVFAVGLDGEDFPRFLLTSMGALYLGDGTYDPYNDGSGIAVYNGPNLNLFAGGEVQVGGQRIPFLGEVLIMAGPFGRIEDPGDGYPVNMFASIDDRALAFGKSGEPSARIVFAANGSVYLGDGQSDPVALPPVLLLTAGVAGSRSTAANTITNNGTFTVFTHPAEDVVLAAGVDGEDFPRIVITSHGSIYLGTGDADPYDDGGGSMLMEGDDLRLDSNFGVVKIGSHEVAVKDFVLPNRVDGGEQVIFLNGVPGFEQFDVRTASIKLGHGNSVVTTDSGGGNRNILDAGDGRMIVQTLEVTEIDGLILHSPDDTRFRIKVANDGTLSTEVVA